MRLAGNPGRTGSIGWVGVALLVAVMTMVEIARHGGRGREAGLTYVLEPVVRPQRRGGGEIARSWRCDLLDGQEIQRSVLRLCDELPDGPSARQRTEASARAEAGDPAPIDRGRLASLAFSMHVLYDVRR